MYYIIFCFGGRKMKKVISLFLSMVMLLSITVGADLSVSASDFIERENNNSFEKANVVEVDDTIYGCLSASDFSLSDGAYGDEDYFKLCVPCDMQLQVVFTCCDKKYLSDNALFVVYVNDLNNYIYLDATSSDDLNTTLKTPIINVKKGDNLYIDIDSVFGTYSDSYMNYSLSIKPYVKSPSNVNVASNSTTSIKLSWSKVSFASGYQVQRYDGSKWKTLVNTKSNSYTDSKLKAGNKYDYRVRTYKTINNKKYYSSYKKLTAVTKPNKVTISSLSSIKKAHKITVKWKKVSGSASGYQIYWSKDSNFKKIVAKTTVSGQSKTSYTGKNFTKGKRYYVKVRAYKTVNGTKYYGAWSNVKSIKAK